jgi:FKBP-type peptidyl-prolyl cis-trans isomerase FkpA
MIQIEELQEGQGDEAKSGDTVDIHYTGSFPEGEVFDSSKGRSPLTFRLGSGGVIQGFDMAVMGMKVGGKRRATIPPEYGYGSRGAGGVIPPNATLVFEVELIRIA